MRAGPGVEAARSCSSAVSLPATTPEMGEMECPEGLGRRLEPAEEKRRPLVSRGSEAETASSSTSVDASAWVRHAP